MPRPGHAEDAAAVSALAKEINEAAADKAELDDKLLATLASNATGEAQRGAQPLLCPGPPARPPACLPACC